MSGGVGGGLREEAPYPVRRAPALEYEPYRLLDLTITLFIMPIQEPLPE